MGRVGGKKSWSKKEKKEQIKKNPWRYVRNGTPEQVFKLPNQQLIFKEEIKARSAENMLWKLS